MPDRNSIHSIPLHSVGEALCVSHYSCDATMRQPMPGGRVIINFYRVLQKLTEVRKKDT